MTDQEDPEVPADPPAAPPVAPPPFSEDDPEPFAYSTVVIEPPGLHGGQVVAAEGTTVWYGPRRKLFAALARAQGSFPPIPRTREVHVKSKSTGAEFSYRYAPLDQVIESCRPALAENGLAFSERLLQGSAGIVLVAYLTHASGAYGEARLNLKPTDDMQDLGKRVTYLRRYQRQAMLGVSPEEDTDAPDEDDDRERTYSGPPRGAPPPRDAHPNAPREAAREPTVERDPEADRRAACAADLGRYQTALEICTSHAEIQALKTMDRWMIKPGVGFPDVEDLVAEGKTAFNVAWKRCKAAVPR